MISPCCNAPSGVDESRKAESLKRGRLRNPDLPAGTMWRQRFCKTCNGIFETIEVTREEFERMAPRLMAAE